MRDVIKMRLIFGLTLTLLVLLSFANTLPEARGNEKDGDTGGPFTLTASTIKNGQQDVPLKPEIKLTFSKNVVNMAVKDANKLCFALENAQGSSAALTVKIADEQIQVDKSREISLVPMQELTPGTTYILKISSELQAKSGVKLGKEVKLTFKTAGAAPVVKPNKPAADLTKYSGEHLVNSMKFLLPMTVVITMFLIVLHKAK